MENKELRQYSAFVQYGYGAYDSTVVIASEHVAQVAALREELAELSDLKAYATIPLRERCAERKDLEQRLTAAEQRNAELVELLRGAMPTLDLAADAFKSAKPVRNKVRAALKPTESGASE